MNKLFMLSLVLLVGCITTTKIEVPVELKVQSIIHNEIKGKFVPDKVFESLMIRYVEWEYYYSKYGNIKE